MKFLYQLQSKKKMKISNSVIIALIIAFTIIGLSILFYMYSTYTHECTANPLVYGAEVYSEMYGYDFVGTGILLIDDGAFTSPTFSFDRNNVTILK